MSTDIIGNKPRINLVFLELKYIFTIETPTSLKYQWDTPIPVLA